MRLCSVGQLTTGLCAVESQSMMGSVSDASVTITNGPPGSREGARRWHCGLMACLVSAGRIPQKDSPVQATSNTQLSPSLLLPCNQYGSSHILMQFCRDDGGCYVSEQQVSCIADSGHHVGAATSVFGMRADSINTLSWRHEECNMALVGGGRAPEHSHHSTWNLERSRFRAGPAGHQPGSAAARTALEVPVQRLREMLAKTLALCTGTTTMWCGSRPQHPMPLPTSPRTNIITWLPMLGSPLPGATNVNMTGLLFRLARQNWSTLSQLDCITCKGHAHSPVPCTEYHSWLSGGRCHCQIFPTSSIARPVFPPAVPICWVGFRRGCRHCPSSQPVCLQSAKVLGAPKTRGKAILATQLSQWSRCI